MPAVKGRDYDSKCWQVVKAIQLRADTDAIKMLERTIHDQQVFISAKCAQLEDLKKKKMEALHNHSLTTSVLAQLHVEQQSVAHLNQSIGVTGMTGGAPPTGAPTGPPAGAPPTSGGPTGTTGPNVAFWNWLFDGNPHVGFTGAAPSSAPPANNVFGASPFSFGPASNPGVTAGGAPSAARVRRARTNPPPASVPTVVPPSLVLPPAPAPVQLALRPASAPPSSGPPPRSSPNSSPTSGVADLFHQVDIDGDDDLLDYEPEQCTICQSSLEELEVGDEEKLLPCGHSFHMNCLNGWIASRINSSSGPTCPQCRAPII